MQTRAWKLTPDGEYHWETLELPPLQPGEALVRLRACGLCTGEVMDWYTLRKAPLVPGHELVGEIVAISEGVANQQVGDRVVVHHHAPCLKCDFCRRGAFIHCPTWRKTKLNPGGLSEYFIAPAEIVNVDVLRVPEGVSDERAAFTEPLACVIRSLRRAGFRHGNSLAIIGMGVMGMLHLMLGQAWGAQQVFVVDKLPHRLAFAESLGATPLHADDARVRSDIQAEVVVVGPGSEPALELALQLVAPDGAIVLFTPAPPETRFPLNWHDAYFREMRLIPSYSASHVEMRQALLHIAAGLPVEKLITHRLPLERTPEGYALLRKAEALKVIVSHSAG
ncbi:MAG: alcohol dehydrogenase catalytic domain-containing protein [Fimbriimonadales bacterium]|nr:alcohol dehydrogenase catalytic domain-containing protein [Fimbriimonadales bacterium]